MFNTNLKLPDPAGPTMWIKVIGNIILVNDLHAHHLAAPRRVCKPLFKKLCTNSLIHNSNPKLIETHLVKVKFEFLQVQAAPPLHLWTDQNASPFHLNWPERFASSSEADQNFGCYSASQSTELDHVTKATPSPKSIFCCVCSDHTNLYCCGKDSPQSWNGMNLLFDNINVSVFFFFF